MILRNALQHFSSSPAGFMSNQIMFFQNNLNDFFFAHIVLGYFFTVLGFVVPVSTYGDPLCVSIRLS